MKLFDHKTATIPMMKTILTHLENGVEHLHTHKFETAFIRTLLDIFRNTDVEIVEVIDHRRSSWGPKFDKKNVKDLRQHKDWSCMESISTFEECRAAKIEYVEEDDCVYATLIIYDGDKVTGDRTTKRVTIEFKLDPKYLISEGISPAIHSEYHSYLKAKYDEHLEEQRKKWILNQSSKIINTPKKRK